MEEDLTPCREKMMTTTPSGLLSMLYKILIKVSVSGSPSYVVFWLKGWNWTLSRKWLGQHFEIFHQDFHCNQCQTPVFQNILRYYFTPSKLSYMFSDSSPLCWENCRETGMYVHCWWFLEAGQISNRPDYRLLHSSKIRNCGFKPLAMLFCFPDT